VKKFFYFNKLISAVCCLPVFFRRCRSRVVLLKKTRSKCYTAWLGAAFGVLIRAAQVFGVAAALPGKLRGMPSNRKAWKSGGFLIAQTARSSKLGFRLLLFLALLLGSASSAQAATVMCSEFGGVVDGNDASDFARVQSASTFGIDMNCTVKNFPESVGGFPITNINFNFPGQQSYYIVFDDVFYYGNMSCNDPTFSDFWIYWTPGGYTDISPSCQEFMVPVDAVLKKNPSAQTTAAVGVPFTYTITAPLLGKLDASGTFQYMANADDSTITSVVIADDLTASGASLTYVSNTAYLVNPNTGDRTSLGPLTLGVSSTWLANHPGVFSDSSKHLVFSYENNPALASIPAGYNIEIDLTVVLDNSPTGINPAGAQFTNTAKMWFDKTINSTNMVNLQAHPGTTLPMTIVGPDLVVIKTSSETALNLGDVSTFTIDVQNTGGGDAWNTTITDNIPAGMCAYDPGSTVTAQIFAADGVTLLSTLDQGAGDYSVAWNGGSSSACQLSLTMESATAVIGPSQHLIITYQSQLDAGVTQDGLDLTNIAGATQWFSGDSSFTDRRQYDRTLTDGTPGVLDFQDSETVTTALSGYYFEKTVEDLNTGVFPATTAAPGDRLRYRVRLFNVDQTIDGITIRDVVDPNSFDLNSFSMVTPPPAEATYSFNSGTGLLEIIGNPPPLSVDNGGELVFEFEITLLSTIINGTAVSNQATLSATGITTESDDPYVNGVHPLDDPNPPDPTVVEIRTPGPLSKANTQGSATIGEQFTYRITVPATPIDVPLHDVRILDDLSLSSADLSFVSATVISGGVWALSNTGSATNLVIEDTATGIDIPANGQAVIDITVELRNTITNQSDLAFANSASYTYNRMNGNNATQTAGGVGGTSNMNVVEPDLTAAKVVSFVTPAGKLPTDPATTGDVLEYSISIPNGGNSTAFDTSVVDTLPADVSLVSGSATAQINGVAVTGFVVTPTILPGGELAWGQQNGDLTLDIPAGQTLVLTYQVLVEAVGSDINNSVYVDWTSLDGGSLAERTGEGCPTTDTLNDYCYGPVTVSVTTLDNTSISKSAVVDSYAETPPSTTDPIVRVGDTVTYDLTLNLQEYTTRNIVVEDELPIGMALESFTIIGGANFSYTLAAQPSAGDTGTLRWEFGDISNQPSNDGTPIDTLVIQYVARVVTDAPPVGVDYDTSLLLNNLARLSYTGGDPTVYPDRLTATETIDVRQPQMRAISKMDLGTGRIGTGTVADPYQVNISTDVMNFQISSCNDGLAPAYNVVITDQLAPELDETDLVLNPPVVKIGTTTLTASIDYDYTAPPRGGEMRIALRDGVPVNPGECITVDYNIGFHTDLGVSNTWSNQAGLPEYRSLPLSQSGRIYTSTNVARVWMTNLVNDEQLLKTLVSPAEATIGDDVVYQITVPAVAMNSALNNVVVTDSLHGALEYVSATAVDGNGAPVTLTDNSVAPADVNLGIGSIPAGEQVIITLTARVVNNDQANAGVAFTNTARYTATNLPGGLDTSSTSGPVTIVEPLLAIAKTVANVSNPGVAPNVGDILRYSVSFTASGGTAGDNFSDAFDLLIEDSLSLGLAYQSGTSSVGGTGNTIADPTITGDGSTTPQTLTWSLADGTADIDVAEGTQVTVTYDVVVLNGVLAGQELTNSATGQWTGLDGSNAFERNGTGTPVENDYFTGPASLTLMTEFAVSIVKSVVNVTTGQGPGTNAEPGDTLRYTIVLTNQSIVPLNNASVVDELDEQFTPGSLQLISVSDTNAVTTNTSATGGANGTGIVDIRDLTLAVQGNPNDSVTIVFEARLAPSIPSGTTVLNRALLTGGNLTSEPSNETSTLISSSPVFRILKTVQDITSGTATVMAGDTLRYTITVKNIGTEDATGVTLRDLVPANTSYVTNSTKLNGAAVADPSAGVSPLQNGMLINSPANPAAGVMPADASEATVNTATITFDVQISTTVVDGTIISNQGFVNGSGAGSGTFPEQPSDNPATPDVPNDPTTVVVGNLPLVYALKTVEVVDNNSDGVVDSGDVLHYTITLTNTGATPATGVVLTDAVPQYTTYELGTATLNGIPVADPSGSPLASGMAVSSSDLTPPLPAAGAGTLSPGESAVVTFDVQVNADVPSASVPPGTLISNQGSVATAQLPTLLTDADGNSSNGYQPTVVVVGNAQQLSIIKSIIVVGGGAALPDSQLEYTIQITNIGMVTATNVMLTDAVPQYTTYVPGTVTLNGIPVADLPSGSPLASGMAVSSSNLTPPLPAAGAGTLSPGSSAVVRFDVKINSNVATGTTVINTASVSWNSPDSPKDASASVNVGAIPGSASLNGLVWHDANFNKTLDGTEQVFADWAVDLYQNGRLLATVYTGIDGTYQINGLTPNDGTTMQYELRFRAPGASSNTAMMGWGDFPPIYGFTSGMQRISNIIAASGSSLQNLNLPLWPNGAVYNSVSRNTIAGATVTLLNAATDPAFALPSDCFDDPEQQNQVTAENGFYKFDLNFSNASCPAGGTYHIEVTPPATGYLAAHSEIIPLPQDNTAATPFPVPECPGNVLYDALPATSDYCEAIASAAVPPDTVSPDNIKYYCYLKLSSGTVPLQSQIFNNFIPLDPELDGAVAITKVSSMTDVTKGTLVPYTITVTNVYGAPLYDISIVDRFPAGFKYVAGSARLDGEPKEPDNIEGRELTWKNLDLQFNQKYTLRLLLVVGSGVSEGEYVNRALMQTATGDTISEEATATVRVIPDPDFDCTDVIGKVFDDGNLNGQQDTGEQGLTGVRVVTARGLISTSDEHGRFHITCAAVPDEDRGSNFILKLDERSLPTGYRLTTENPRVQRATRGKMLRFNFGATIHRVVRIDIADGVFEPDTTELRMQWTQKIDQLLEELKKGPSVLRLSYLVDVERNGIVQERLEALKKEITKQWKESDGGYRLTIETEIFWRRGAPLAGQR